MELGKVTCARRGSTYELVKSEVSSSEFSKEHVWELNVLKQMPV